MAAPYSISFRHHTAAVTVKFTVRKLSAQEQIWRTSGTPAFETYTTSNVDKYGNAMVELGTASKLYVGNMPTSTAGLYVVECFECAGANLAETDPLVGGPMIVNWDGTNVVSTSDSVTGVTMTFSATGNDSEIQFLSYWAGAGFPIRLVASPPAAIDVSLCQLRIGIPGSFTTFLPGAGRLVAENAATGILLAYPTVAESAAWPREGCLIQLWRTGTGVANTGPMGHGVLKIRETLR